MYEYRARVVKVVDGDTIDCDVDLGFYLTTRQRFRILGIDAPEVRGAEKEAGRISKHWLWTKLMPRGEGQWVVLQTEKADSFGRWLSSVTLEDGTNIASEMIRLQLASEYKK